MFNKSTLFNRNDPLPRRDAVPAAAPTGPGSARPATAIEASAGRPNSAKDAPSPAASSAAPATVLPTPTPDAPPSPARREGAAERGGDTGSAGDSGLGARLIVGPDVKLKGAEILDCDTLVVEGRVEATMDSRVIRIAEYGAFIGKVSIDVAEIHGSFEGELTARAQLIIHATGRVTGTIRYGKLVADEGCELCGDINVLGTTPAAKPKEDAGSAAVLGGMAN